MNGHFLAEGGFEHGVQVVDEDKAFNSNVADYLSVCRVAEAGFNYHLVSVFGSQSTGKSTLLNHLFGTDFSVMSETERRQTTKGIWMAKNKRADMADNILVMDVEGTDGRERGEDQDFERKSALFALATSEVLIVNIWEHQVGLYQGANMGLLKTVFEVNLQLFLKDKQSTPRSLLFFVIRDHIGTTPLSNLRTTLTQDLTKIWSTIAKPEGLEGSRIEDYFDFAFAALPHKILQEEKFRSDARQLGSRFVPGHRVGKPGSHGDQELEGGVFLPEYHRRIPADGLSVYAEGIWDQIVHNKDLDLPTQQELLAQFRCDEISRDVLLAFDLVVVPLEERQTKAAELGKPLVLADLGATGSKARSECVRAFEAQAGRYHKGTFSRKKQELEGKVDTRLKALYQGQLAAAHKAGVAAFSEAVSGKVKTGQKTGGYDFADIVAQEKASAVEAFEAEVTGLTMQGVAWTDFGPQCQLFEAELDEVSGRLRKEEMRRLATRVERWVRSRLGEDVGLEFNKLGSGRGGSGAPETGEMAGNAERQLWDRIWTAFTGIVAEAESRFAERARSFDASGHEVEIGMWRLRRKSWVGLREKIEEEVMDGNILLKLRENFEDKFRYDEAGVPRIWRPSDDIEGLYTKARESTLTLIPLLSRFQLSESGYPDLPAFIGPQPEMENGDEEDLAPIGGVDEGENESLEEEMMVLSEAKRQDLVVRFKKTADGVYVEAKRSAIGGVAQVPWYFYGLLMALGWNEFYMVLRNPFLCILLLLMAGGTYVAYTLNLVGPMMQMGNAAVNQGIDIAKQQLRDFIVNSETARQALAVPSSSSDTRLDALDGRGKKVNGDDGGDDGDDGF
ncbi:Protein SEY1 [Ophiocordyceps camponoti-floridani]|uniref:Protein SEY1 n=1 Tax=Ophiocordyceps camponoti-floridani TaxID=2030778 RepID=A0A8H4Q1I0_9HYPO|nr:Protein SEY1 [Ophiocordyceps camponoti-floridani]